MWQQYRPHGLELAALAASAQGEPATKATAKHLLTFICDGARIVLNIRHALQTLRLLRGGSGIWIREMQEQMHKAGVASSPPGKSNHEPAVPFAACDS